MCLEIELYKGSMILGSPWNITWWYIDRSCCWRSKYHVTISHKVVSKNNKWRNHTWEPCQIIYSLLKLFIIFHIVFNFIIATIPSCTKRPLKRNPTNQSHENRCASKIILILIYTQINKNQNQTWCRLTLYKQKHGNIAILKIKQFKRPSESLEASISDISQQINMTYWIIHF